MIGQADFSAGMVRASARDLIPENGAYDIRGGLLDDDGNVYLRGPTARATTTQLGVALQGLFEANFAAGRRLLALSTTSFGVVDAAGTGWSPFAAVLAGVTGGGLTAQLGDLLFVPTSGGVYMYGGSRRTTAAYVAGTVTVTNGSAIVTGVGTAWLGNIDAGSLLVLPSQSAFPCVVKSVDSNTQITLTLPWRGATAAAAGYGLGALATARPNTTCVAAAGGRLFAGEGRVVRISKTTDPTTGQSRPMEFDVNDFHEFPADVVALAALRDRVFVFTKAGVYVISNGALEIVDAFGNAQHRVEKVSGDVVLRSPGGLAPWRDALVVAAVDGIYTMDAGGGLQLVSRSISPFWQALMQAGSQVWQIATFRDHVFVPVGGQVLIGRLDRVVTTPSGKSSPWVRVTDGEAASCAAFAVQDPSGSPKLVAGSNLSGYLLDLTGLFVGQTLSAAANARDADASPYSLYLETREFVLGGGLTPTYVDRLMLDYESSNGTVSVLVSKAKRATPAAAPTFDALSTAAAGNYTTQAPRAIAVRKTGRRISFAFATTGSCAGLRLRGFTASTRERGLQR